MVKILLIGKTGQLGSAIMEDAKSFGFEIVSFGKEELDVTKESQVKEKIEKTEPDILINTSAYHVVPKCEENPLKAMAVNFLAVQNLAKICKKQDIIFVTYSTDYVFD
jgi:dTDP-4-dehydrorhamnose reductase